MSHMPRDPLPDATPALLRDGYTFIGKRCRRRGSDVVRTRLMMQSTICMTGPAAARLFYDEDRFARENAAPRRVRRTLFGEGAVQGMDGAAHRHRKQMFMSLMGTESISRLLACAEDEWRMPLDQRWPAQHRIVLFEEVEALLCRAVFAWAGVPLGPEDVPARTRDLGALVDGAGAVGAAHWTARYARRRADRWAGRIIRDVRAERLQAPPGSAAHTIAWHRALDGNLLDEHVAAVELLNVLRPTVAVARYVVFIAHALHHFPEHGWALQGADDAAHERFVQEVRRFYPFFPFAVARVRKDFAWYGHPFRSGERVLLDLYGTDRDPRAWPAPEQFRPERFAAWSGGAFDFVPQGGGDHALGHRCAGEWLTISLMKLALRQLTEGMDYRVPRQDLGIDLARIPALPRSGFVIEGVQPRVQPRGTLRATASS